MFPFYFSPLNSDSKKKNDSPDIADCIGIMLFFTGCAAFFSAIVFCFINPLHDDKWLIRFFLSMVCFGFYAIIKKLRN